MKKQRIIPRLDIKNNTVVKGIHLEGLRVVGIPTELAQKYYKQGADELLYMDIVASLYERNNLLDIIEKTTAAGIFIPVTVGGGIRSIEDIRKVLRAGADKVAINTKATRNPALITEAARIFGSQCIVGSIEAKRRGNGTWEAYIDNGREGTGLEVIAWAKRLVALGVGELLITSIDQEGTEKGLDEELMSRITAAVSVPVIAGGGAGSIEHLESCFKKTHCDGIAVASLLHYNKKTIPEIKITLAQEGIAMRSDQITKKQEGKSAPHAKKSIAIIDYEAGNLKSVIRAFMLLGNNVQLVNTPQEIERAERLVLPGDGAFGFGMQKLQEKNLIPAIRKHVAQGKPLLGICLGMQLLMGESEEFGTTEGLNIIPGKVQRFPAHTPDPIPHMGWNNVQKTRNAQGILAAFSDNSEAYFIHSYYVVPENKEHNTAQTQYAGKIFCSVLQHQNVSGTQFHPEKSGEQGLQIIQSFCS